MRGSAAANGASAGTTLTLREGLPGAGIPSTKVVGASAPGRWLSTRSAAAWKPSRNARNRFAARDVFATGPGTLAGGASEAPTCACRAGRFGCLGAGLSGFK